MASNRTEQTMKVVLIGNGKTGKTAIFKVITDQEEDLMRSTKIPTVDKFVDLHGRTIKLWDTPGGKNYAGYGTQQLRESKAVIFFASVDQESSSSDLVQWKTKVDDQCGDCQHFLFINKVDIPVEERKISPEEIIEQANDSDYFPENHIFQVTNVDQSSKNAMNTISDILYKTATPTESVPGVDIEHPNQNQEQNDRGCC